MEDLEEEEIQETEVKQEHWTSHIEFILSLLSMSVAVGTVWKFPFTALEYGGGAFIISYLSVLLSIGLPIFYLEMIVAQFSGKGCTKIYDMCPAMRGVGIGQTIVANIMSTYFASLMAIVLKYVYDSFSIKLPWSYCRESWNISYCVLTHENRTIGVAAAELYLRKEVLQGDLGRNLQGYLGRSLQGNLGRNLKEDLQGIGPINPELAFALVIVWLTTLIPLRKGIKTTGSASFFLALFPHCVLALLFFHTIFLPGSLNAIQYLFIPQWHRITEVEVWVAALSHCFLSLGICLSMTITYSSYELLDRNVARNAILICSVDTVTSIVASAIFFGLLGNLAHVINKDIIGILIDAGESGLVSFLIYYSEAIALQEGVYPQILSVSFFLMLYILGVGSIVAMVSCAITDIKDYFHHLKSWLCALVICFINFLFGLFYIASGGQHFLDLVDFYGVTLPSLILGFFEIITFSWIYGCNRICRDMAFITQIYPKLFWRLSWAVISPILMLLILLGAIFHIPLKFDQLYPKWAINYGKALTYTIFALFVIIMFFQIIRRRGSCSQKLKTAFFSPKYYHPRDIALLDQYRSYHEARKKSKTIIGKIKINIRG